MRLTTACTQRACGQVRGDEGWARRSAPRSGCTFLVSGPVRVCAGREEAEEFWRRVAATAWQAGLGRDTRQVVVLGDDAPWI